MLFTRPHQNRKCFIVKGEITSSNGQVLNGSVCSHPISSVPRCCTLNTLGWYLKDYHQLVLWASTVIKGPSHMMACNNYCLTHHLQFHTSLFLAISDSVWAVYILPEEVGSRVNALGVHVVALRSRGTDNQPGQLDIISLVDPSTPIVTWDRDKMRRTGCLGNMVFIEIGRRCHGGPGLVWMYAGPRETAALRETLHTLVLFIIFFIHKLLNDAHLQVAFVSC